MFTDYIKEERKRNKNSLFINLENSFKLNGSCRVLSYRDVLFYVPLTTAQIVYYPNIYAAKF